MSKRVANKGRARTGSGKPWARSTNTRPAVMAAKRARRFMESLPPMSLSRWAVVFDRIKRGLHRGKK